MTEARLNPYHTHQILVDAARYDGTMPWGDEIGVRSQLGQLLRDGERRPCRAVGDPRRAEHARYDDRVGKRGLSLVYLRLWRCGNGARAVLPRRHQQSDDPVFAKEEAKLEALKSMDNVARSGSLMTFFCLADDDAEESMSTALLRCLFRNLMFYQVTPETRSSTRLTMGKVIHRAQEAVSRRRDHMQRALMLAVKWNQVNFCEAHAGRAAHE